VRGNNPKHRDHGNAPRDQVCGHFRKSIVGTARPAVVDDEISTLDITNLLEALSECGGEDCERARSACVEKAHDRQRALLRARSERPRCRAADK
jgi:hypothetical protein